MTVDGLDVYRPGDRIDVLPDDVLLGIFDYHMIMNPSLFGSKRGVEVWQTLVHVCRRWRYLVFGSPRRLKLRLCCSPKTPAKDTVDVWPALPLVVKGDMALSGTDTDNIIAALGRSNHVHDIHLWGFAGRQLEKALAVMQVPFPELTDLRLHSKGETLPVVPDSFLGGSAPRLEIFSSTGLPFPGLPKLLLSVNHLLYLELINIPHSGYFSPQAMIDLLPVLSSLRRLHLRFQSPQSHPNRETRRPPPSKRSVLPALDEFHLKAATEYSEELVNSIDTPQLRRMFINFFNQIDFACPRLAQFINRTPTLRTLNYAQVQFDTTNAGVSLRDGPSGSSFGHLEIAILCREQDWQLSFIEQVCNSSLPSVPTVEDLYIDRRYVPLVWKNDAIDDTLWLQLLLPFTAVKNLYLSKEFTPGIAAALRELVRSRITDALPNLQTILVEELEPSGPLQKIIGQFVAARQLSDHPVIVSVWSKTPT